MALRDWQLWQIAALWAAGIVVEALLLRRAFAWVTGVGESGGIAGVSAVVLPLVVAGLVGLGLIAVTVSWMRAAR